MKFIEQHPNSTFIRKLKSPTRNPVSDMFGGDEGDRTPYLLTASQALSQNKR